MSELLCLPTHEQPSVLNELKVRCLVDRAEMQRWNELVCEHHYLENANLVGEQLRYVITFRGQWLALLGCSAASFHLKDRDRWLGLPIHSTPIVARALAGKVVLTSRQ